MKAGRPGSAGTNLAYQISKLGFR